MRATKYNSLGRLMSQKALGLLVALTSSVVLSTSMAHADVAQKYQDTCAACHDSGALNAPKTGDTAQWQKLKSEKGMSALVKSVKNGMSQMPAGGLCAQCSDSDYEALINYMSK